MGIRDNAGQGLRQPNAEAASAKVTVRDLESHVDMLSERIDHVTNAVSALNRVSHSIEKHAETSASCLRIICWLYVLSVPLGLLSGFAVAIASLNSFATVEKKIENDTEQEIRQITDNMKKAFDSLKNIQ